MDELPLRPKSGGFFRAFGCAEFIRGFLMGQGPYGARVIDPSTGAPQCDIFQEYKLALIRETAFNRATKLEEKRAKKSKRPIEPANIEELASRFAHRMPYKTFSTRYHSFVVYFTMLQRLGWVESTGREEPSAFQVNSKHGQPRRYYRLTPAGWAAPPQAWANPQRTLSLL